MGKKLGQGRAARLFYTMDDVNYPGGAHVASFAQIKFLQKKLGIDVVVLSLTEPKEELKTAYPWLNFVVNQAQKGQSTQKAIEKLLLNVLPKDSVCVPFENSIFRRQVAQLQCFCKLQWVHIDYATWQNLNGYTRQITADDGQLYEKFNTLVFVSQMAKDGFVKMHPHLEGKCRVCHNILDVEKICQMAKETPENPVFAQSSGLKLLTVARMQDGQKAIGRCLLAAKALKDKGCNFVWAFVGAGTDEDMAIYRSFVANFGLLESVVFVGAQKNPCAYMAAADVFCLFSQYEGIANTIFEAMMAGTPVMASRVGAAEEQIKKGAGWLVENSTKDIVNGLLHLANSPQEILEKRQSLANYCYPIEEIEKKVADIFCGEFEPKEAEMGPLVSVIVPVYNVEEYLDECLASLAEQSLEDIEVIMVNDGSTDGSGQIMEKYAQEKPGKFICIHKQNEGLGKARNTGMEKARAKYVAFVDGDDKAAPSMMEELLTAMQKNNCDIVQIDLQGFYTGATETVVERCPFGQEGIVPKKQLMLNSTRPVVASACTKLCRKSLFSGLQFPDIWYEDLCIFPIMFSRMGNMYYLPKPLYFYRWGRKGSIQSQKNKARTLDILTAKQRVLDLAEKEWRQEAAFAVYEHCCRFFAGTPKFAVQTLQFVQNNVKHFAQNQYVEEKIANENLANLLPCGQNLPKIIHYCQFESAPQPKEVLAALQSWQKYLPGYAIKKWSEKDIDLGKNPYVQRAYMQKDWRALASYIAFTAIFEEGGLYLDAGLLLKAPAEKLLPYKGVFVRAGQNLASWEFMAAEKHLPLVKNILQLYEEKAYDKEDFLEMRKEVWQLICQGQKPANSEGTQVFAENVVLYPAKNLLVDTADGQNTAELICDAFLPDEGGENPIKRQMLKIYYSQCCKESGQEKTAGVVLASTPRQIVDEVIVKYGVIFAMRAAARRVLRVIFGKK